MEKQVQYNEPPVVGKSFKEEEEDDDDEDRLSDVTAVSLEEDQPPRPDPKAVEAHVDIPSGPQASDKGKEKRIEKSGWRRLFRNDKKITSTPDTQSRGAGSSRANGPLKEESAGRIQRLINSCLVTFQAGLEVQHLITGYELCTVTLRNLRPDTTPADVARIFRARSIGSNEFFLLGTQITSDGKCVANVVTHINHGIAMTSANAAASNASVAGPSFQLGTYTSPGSMAYATAGTEIMNLSWNCPSLRYVIDFSGANAALRCLKKLRGRSLLGRAIQVESMPAANNADDSKFLELIDVDPSANDDDIRSWVAGTSQESPISVMPYNSFVFSSFRKFIASSSRRLKSFSDPGPLATTGGGVVLCATFDSWAEAHRIFHIVMDTNYLATLNVKNKNFFLGVPPPDKYCLTVPSAHHAALWRRWGYLTKDMDRRLVLTSKQEGDSVTMTLAGSGWEVKRAVGAVKVKVEKLAAGEEIEGWHSSFADPQNQFLRSLPGKIEGYLVVDRRWHTLKVIGDPSAVKAVQDLVAAEIQQLPKDPAPIRPNAGIKPVDDICPVCYNRVSDPFTLDCGHVYCSTCLHSHLLNSKSPEDFPITCLGDKARCALPISNNTIREFLLPSDFSRLLRSAYNAYVAGHGKEFGRCITPECSQIYRFDQKLSTQAAIKWPTCTRCTSGLRRPSTHLRCPSCFVGICPKCHKEEHDGQRCNSMAVDSADSDDAGGKETGNCLIM